MLEVDETFTTIWLSKSSEVSVKVRRWPQSPVRTIFSFGILILYIIRSSNETQTFLWKMPGIPHLRAVMIEHVHAHAHTHTHTHTDTFYGPLNYVRDYPGEPIPEPVWILLKQETVSGSGISWAICKSALRPRQITMPALHHSVFYRPDTLHDTQPTASKHWRHPTCTYNGTFLVRWISHNWSMK